MDTYAACEIVLVCQNGSLDLVFVDAAHDYANVKADVLAYWPKLKPEGVISGHDFSHARNWAHSLEARLKLAGRGHNSLPPAYGVGLALAEVFAHCEVHVLFGVWWVERRFCWAGPIAS